MCLGGNVYNGCSAASFQALVLSVVLYVYLLCDQFGIQKRRQLNQYSYKKQIHWLLQIDPKGRHNVNKCTI